MPPKKGSQNANMVAVPFLREFMTLAGAQDLILADASGVSHCTIWRAKAGKPISRCLANQLIQTLEERLF